MCYHIAVNRYTYRIEWSPHYDEYVGSCIEVPSLRRQAPTAQEAIAEIETAVDEFVAGMQTCGETPPTPLTQRSYSGTFMARTSPELHGRLSLEAAERRVSMNQWVVQKLSGRESGSGLFGFD
jgi:predicted HicB family RNase H-like nuclease